MPNRKSTVHPKKKAAVEFVCSNKVDSSLGVVVLLQGKQNTPIAGHNITISNNTISATNLIFQLDGVTQNTSTVNFIQNNALLSNGVLNISRLKHYDKIPLIYSTSSTIKDLTQSSTGEMLWNGLELQLKQNTVQQYNFVRPITSILNTGTGSLTIKSIWMPSTVSGGMGIFVDNANDTLGTLTLSSYSLRWLISGVPSLNIQCLHFKSGFSVTETFNLTTNRNQLDIYSQQV